MTASLSARQDNTARYSAFPLSPLQDAERAASQLRTLLMDMAPAAAPQRWSWPARRSVARLGLVDMRLAAPHVRILPAPPWSAAAERHWVRPGVAGRLEAAAQILGPDFALGFWEGFRPLSIQTSLWQTGLELVAAMYPGLSPAQLELTLETFIARPTAQAPHARGIAVDVALLDATGRVLEDRAHLNVLANALRDAGLSNYEPEWWHWSYDAGDA